MTEEQLKRATAALNAMEPMAVRDARDTRDAAWEARRADEAWWASEAEVACWAWEAALVFVATPL